VRRRKASNGLELLRPAQMTAGGRDNPGELGRNHQVAMSQDSRSARPACARITVNARWKPVRAECAG